MTGHMPDCARGPLCPACGEWFGSRRVETDTCAGCGKSWREANRAAVREVLRDIAHELQPPLSQFTNRLDGLRRREAKLASADALTDEEWDEIEAEVAEEYEEVTP